MLAASTNDDKAGNSNDDARALLDRAEALRREIAAMEGKTLEEVQDEAKTKRQQQEDRLAAAAASRRLTDDARKQQQVTSMNDGRYLEVPSTFDDMTRQAARAVQQAMKDGLTRQTVRFNLISEGQSPTDENEWPGGARQMYREAGKPLTNSLLQELIRLNSSSNTNTNTGGGTIKQQDLWDFDGSALHTVEAKDGPQGDIQAVVFPNTDVKYLNDIEQISRSMGPSRLVVLVNPFWRNIDSWSFNLLQPGAKRRAEDVIFGGRRTDTGSRDNQNSTTDGNAASTSSASGGGTVPPRSSTTPSSGLASKSSPQDQNQRINHDDVDAVAFTTSDVNIISKENPRSPPSSSPATQASSPTSTAKLPFEETYNLQVFQCRGELCVALKVYPYEGYQLFAYREQDDVGGYNYGYAQDYAIRLGSTKEEPTSSIVTELLNSRPEFKDTKTMRQMRRNIRG
jgi:hypothetical protein